MRRLFPPCLLVLAFATPAPAVPITGYAVGQITRDRTQIGPPAFLVGDPVYVTWRYDTDHPYPDPAARLEIDIRTPGGFRSIQLAVGDLAFIFGSPEDPWLATSNSPVFVDLRFRGGLGRLDYDDISGRVTAFTAFVTQVADDDPFPLPEPSAISMGLVGAALAGLGWRRSAAGRGCGRARV